MNIKILPRWAVIPIVIGGLAGALAGCGQFANLHATVCSQGKCATANVNTSSPAAPSSAPESSSAPTTAAPVTSTPADASTVTATPSVTPTFVVAGCSLYLTHDELKALAYTVSARNQLAICMQIPGATDIPQSAGAVAFENQLALDALEALQSGNYSPFPGKLDSLRQQYVPSS